ncbi:hypothetical protein D3C71_1244980 [compost metagenome]
MGANIRPSWRCRVKIGMCAAMMISIEKKVGRPTSDAADNTVAMRSRRVLPGGIFDMRETMCSVTITAPSMMMPKSIAPSESRLAGTPHRCRPRKVDSKASGIIAATINAARAL